MSIILEEGDALLIVDLQRDFLPGGNLPVPNGHKIIKPVNRYIEIFFSRHLPIIATRDWHPKDHCSFIDQGGIWPSHCVQGTDGALFPEELMLPEDTYVVSKATLPEIEAYSGFEYTDLIKILGELNVKRLFVCGLATDYCVLHTVIDALNLGFDTCVLLDAVKAVDIHNADGEKAIKEMREQGAGLIYSGNSMVDSLLTPGLLTDFYQITMLKAYLDHELDGQACFEFFVRRSSEKRSFLVAAGLEQVINYLLDVRFTEEDLSFLKQNGLPKKVTEYLKDFRFRGDIWAVPEGSIVFPGEPILRVEAPLPIAQVIETRLINILHFQTLIASKAVRCVLAAKERPLVDFGLRRAHGGEAGLLAARACYIAGFSATATVEAGLRFGIPLSGTMAHSFVLAHETEEAAFRDFAESRPKNLVLLIDTYDTLKSARRITEIYPEFRDRGIDLKAVRIDSGDLLELSRQVRDIFDRAGLDSVGIFCSGSLDEYKIKRFVDLNAPIDGFGVGTKVDTSADAPFLDCAYKMVEYEGQPKMKYSEGKATLPCRKQIFRQFDESSGLFKLDIVGVIDEDISGKRLLKKVVEAGRLTGPPENLETIRKRLRDGISHIPQKIKEIFPIGQRYPVEFSDRLKKFLK
ncbi:MAG: nicotinate phosphoribosyltransferase [Nitrospiraceae bacterium]|nr:nicotinate phosphoribosyltransferase [Nitrospiraceae bacterium]